MKAEHPTTLQLGRVPHPAIAGRTAQAFGPWEIACRHLEDQLPTAAECDVWPPVVAEVAWRVRPSADRNCPE